MATYEDFLAHFNGNRHEAAGQFEDSCLSVGEEFLTEAEIAVLNGGEPTPEYWDAMIESVEASEALDAVNCYNSGEITAAECAAICGPPLRVDAQGQPVTVYRCTSDRYDPTGGHYDSLDDFLAMCRACFGEAPELRRDGESYRDDQGIVLEPAAASA